MKNIRIFLSDFFFHFLVVKFSVYLNSHVFVMFIFYFLFFFFFFFLGFFFFFFFFFFFSCFVFTNALISNNDEA